MTHDDEQRTARELLESVAADAMKDAPKVESVNDLLEMIADKLRDEPDVMEQIRDNQLTGLAQIAIHDLGTTTNANQMRAGMVGLSFLAFTNNPGPIDLLNTMHNTDATALALISHIAADDGDQALMIIAAKDDTALLVAVAETTGQRNSGAFAIDRDELLERAPTNARNSLQLFTALLNAAGRRAQ